MATRAGALDQRDQAAAFSPSAQGRSSCRASLDAQARSVRTRPRSFGRSSLATIGVGALPMVATKVRVPITSPAV